MPDHAGPMTDAEVETLRRRLEEVPDTLLLPCATRMLLARLDAAAAAASRAAARAGELEAALRGLVAAADRDGCMFCHMGYTGGGGCTHEPEELRAARRALGGEAP